MPTRLCLEPGCGRLTHTSRCPAHEAERWAVRRADRPIAARVVADGAADGCQCQGCGLHTGRCSARDDLTAEHLLPLARGGTNTGKRVVMCRRCNSSRGARA